MSPSSKQLIYSFSTKEKPSISQVGSKGISLILSTQYGLSVPSGFVLTVEFFKPWLNIIEDSQEWQNVLNSSDDELKQTTDIVKQLCENFQFTIEQQETIISALKTLQTKNKLLLAVRSSSQEEDLEGASFAGAYETSLGITEETLEDAIKKSFASCLDARIFLYKKEHKLDVTKPSIAVIIQKQIKADVSGVAFSLNPLTNYYDEAVINANFGLGETVMSGKVTPDQFIINKINKSLIEQKTGSKETSVWIRRAGGTYEKPSPTRSQVCLSDDQIIELTDLILKVEEYYKKPIDIEWAYKKNKLYLLQVRPITDYIPLPDVMMTDPGEPKRLYADMTLIKQAIQEPLSVMGTDYLAIVESKLMANMSGKDLMTARTVGVPNAIRVTLEGRSYFNLSNNLKVEGKRKLLKLIKTIDNTAAEIIESIDTKEYKAKKTPKQLRFFIFKILPYNWKIFHRTFQTIFKTERYHQWYLNESEKFITELKQQHKKNLPINEDVENKAELIANFITKTSLPLTAAAELARLIIKILFKKEKKKIRNKIVYLERSLPHNITIEMGLEMYRLSQFEEIKKSTSTQDFIAKMNNKSFSIEFQEAWNAFMKQYGFRCPRELDIATVRYYENPLPFVEQLISMTKNTDKNNNQEAIFKKAKKLRKAAYQELLETIPKRKKIKRWLFNKSYKILVALGGYREIHKYYYILALNLIRKKVLKAGQNLVEAGRIDNINQVFDLNFEDLHNSLIKPDINLRAMAEKNTQYLKKTKHIKNVPLIIDSRGKIFHLPKKKVKKGEIAGQPISPGIIRGKVKILNYPEEKPLHPGEILVARATDPGWTPLFINAAGVILEVGGLLQHGALVAREYGKPCVAGIENVTSRLKDGQEVEINGMRGVVKII